MKTELIKEVWKPVPNYEGLYDVSNFGRVKSLDRLVNAKGGSKMCKKGKFLKPRITNDGYTEVHLSKDNKGKMLRVHRLVCEAFNGPIPEGMQVNHINEIKTDNSLWNLNLMTNQENCNYGRHNFNVSKSKINGSQSSGVRQLTLDYQLVCVWPSMAEAERQTGISHANISNCCNGKQKQANGFLWEKI